MNMGIFSLTRPLRKYELYVERANSYELIFLRKKAIETMKDALKQLFSKKEIASGLIYLGILYEKMKELNQASDYYHQALELTSKVEFKYHRNFKKAIETFIRNREEQRALYWLNNLLERQR
ncbi:tetratricopeptide repeat protein, partial [Paenibacillus sp. TAF58]